MTTFLLILLAVTLVCWCFSDASLRDDLAEARRERDEAIETANAWKDAHDAAEDRAVAAERRATLRVVPSWKPYAASKGGE